MRLGDWARVVQLIEQGAGNDESLKRAYKHLGDFSAERQKWQKAAKYYALSQDNDSLIESYYKLEDTTNMEKMIEVLPENSPLLDKLAEKFASLGISELASACYVKSGDVKKAIDCCVLLNQWNQAVELAE
jgi:WD repeat-containing protein 35